MDIPNTLLPTMMPHYRTHRDKRGTLHIRTPNLTEDERKKWYGAAPVPLPELDRNWRPSEFKF